MKTFNRHPIALLPNRNLAQLNPAAQNPGGELCAVGSQTASLPHARRKTPTVLRPPFANQHCQTSCFHNSPGAKLEAFAPLNAISTSNENRNTRPANTLRIATQKPPKQNPQNPERQPLMHSKPPQ